MPTDRHVHRVTVAVLLVAGLALAGGVASADAGAAATNETEINQTYTVSVVSSGYGFDYVIDGVENRQLTLQAGETYQFELDDSVAGHPFHLSTSANGGGATYPSAQVTEGVSVSDPYDGDTAAAETGTVTVTVPEEGFDAEALYYQCGVHSGMGASITVEEAPRPNPGLPTLPGAAGPAADTDGDGTFEDVNGDGQTDLFDALDFYNNRDSDAVQSNPDSFDFDGDGDTGDLFDALALFNDIT